MKPPRMNFRKIKISSDKNLYKSKFKTHDLQKLAAICELILKLNKFSNRSFQSQFCSFLSVCLVIFYLVSGLVAFPSRLNAQEDSLGKLKDVLLKKKRDSQPFNEKDLKVDLESLGLDNVDKKPNPDKNSSATSAINSQNNPQNKPIPILSKPSAAIDATKQNSGISANSDVKSNPAQSPSVLPVPTLAKQNEINGAKNINSQTSPSKADILEDASIAQQAKIKSVKVGAATKNQPQVKNVNDKESVDKNEPVVIKSDKKGCFVKKEIDIDEFELPKKPLKPKVKTSAKIVKKRPKVKTRRHKNAVFGIVKDVQKELDKPILETTNELDIQKRSQELQDLQTFYLQEESLNSDNSAIDQDFIAEGRILPRKKDLNNYIVEELPPIPILNRSRSYDNLHIPYVLTPKEKIDIMFSAISLGSVTFFNEAFKYVQNPNIYNDQGDTILTYALLIKKYPVIASVLAKGADPNLPNKLGHTPVEIAIEMIDFKALEMLANNNANLKYVDSFGRTYLMHAARVGFLPAVDLLVRRGIDVNVMDEDGFTALSIAYRHKKELIVQYLLKNGAKTWEEKKFIPEGQNLIQELENRWQ